MRTSPSRKRAFSLIELIVVILIIGIVAAFVTPAASTILRGSQLTQAAQIVTDQITLARQLALTKNRQVEVRLIRFADPGVPGEVVPGQAPDPANGAFRAIQCFEIFENGAAVPMDKAQLLPQAVIMNSSPTLSPQQQFSTLIDYPGNPAMPARQVVTKTQVSADATAPNLPRNIEKNYEYVAFRFLPDGGTNLPAPPTPAVWCVTLHNMNDIPSGPALPKNFFTLQIDPVSGTTKSYRPGV